MAHKSARSQLQQEMVYGGVASSRTRPLTRLVGNFSKSKVGPKKKFALRDREFLFLTSTPGLYRKKCKACQDDNHFNSKECKRYGCALDIQSPGRPRGTTASEGYGVSVVHATCSYGY